MNQSDEPVKSKGGRPRGSKNKIGNRTPCRTWLADLVEGAYPRSEYLRRWKLLPPEVQFAICAKLAPRDLKLDSKSTVRMEVIGLLVGEAYKRKVLESKSARTLPPSTEAEAVAAAHMDYQYSEREEE